MSNDDVNNFSETSSLTVLLLVWTFILLVASYRNGRCRLLLVTFSRCSQLPCCNVS